MENGIERARRVVRPRRRPLHRPRRPREAPLQFAHRDEFITYWDAAVYLQAASSPKEVQWYDTDHYFNAEARKARGEWLERILGTGPLTPLGASFG